MRGWLLAMVLVTPVLVGCIGADPTDDARQTPDAQDPEGLIPAAPEPFRFLVCQDRALVPLESDHDSGCNTQLTTDNGPAAEVSLAVNPNDPLNLVGGSKDFTLGEDRPCSEYNVWSGVYWTKDGGHSWHHDLLPGHPGDDRRTALSAYDCGSDPVVVFGPDGTVYYVSIHVSLDTEGQGPVVPQLGPVYGYPVENASIAVTRSTDGGETWEDPVILGHKDAGEGIFDKEWAAVDPTTGQVYVSYIDTGDGVFYVQRSDDGGVTWTDPIQVFEWGDGVMAPDGGQFGQLEVAPDGTVHFTYWGYGGPDASAIYHRSSTDGGQSWSQAHQVATFVPLLDLEFTHKYRIVPNPDLAVDREDGTLYVAFASPATDGVRPQPPQNTDIYVASSTDGGQTWADPVRVNDDLVGPQNEQWMATAEVGPDGTVHVTWLDYRDDPEGQWAYVYYAYSQDEGQTWSTNARVSDVPFDGTGGYHQSGSGTIGDYMGLAVSELAVHPFWADTRHDRNDVFAAIIPAQGDASTG